MGREIGIASEDIYAELMPADKAVAIVDNMHSEGKVSFVGDGVNDGAAFPPPHTVAMGYSCSDAAEDVHHS